MDIVTKARELGELIAASSQMAELKTAEAVFQADAKAIELMNEYNNMQVELVQKARSSAGQEEIDSLRQKLLDKKDELEQYEGTRRYLNAKKDLDKLIKTVNDVITFAITGEEPCSSDKCSSCSGCG